MTTARQARGKRTNVVVAAWLRTHGWLRAEPTVGAETGPDVQHVGVHCIEVKARSDFDPRKWWRQAKDNARDGQRPVCIVRFNGQGEEAADYLVFRRLEDDELNRLRFGCGEGCTGYGCSFCESTVMGDLGGASSLQAAGRQAGHLQRRHQQLDYVRRHP